MALNEDFWASQVENTDTTIPGSIEPWALNDVFAAAELVAEAGTYVPEYHE